MYCDVNNEHAVPHWNHVIEIILLVFGLYLMHVANDIMIFVEQFSVQN